MSTDLTEASGPTKASAGRRFSKNTRILEGNCSGYETSYYGRTSADTEASTEEWHRTPSHRPVVKKPQPAVARYELMQLQERASRFAHELQSAVNENELRDASVHGIELKETLQELWSYRKQRNDDWATIVNFLQAALSHQLPESLKPAQCTTFCTIIDTCLSASTGDYEVERSIQILRSGGFDPWKSVSAPTFSPAQD